MIEKWYRSVLKTVSWRLTGTIDTIVISYLITGKWKAAFSIGLIEVFTKLILYYIHERAWNLISVGRFSEKNQLNNTYHI